MTVAGGPTGYQGLASPTPDQTQAHGMPSDSGGPQYSDLPVDLEALGAPKRIRVVDHPSTVPDWWASALFVLSTLVYLSFGAMLPSINDGAPDVPGATDDWEPEDGRLRPPFRRLLRRAALPPSPSRFGAEPEQEPLVHVGDGWWMFGLPMIIGLGMSLVFLAVLQRHADRMIAISYLTAISFTAIMGIFYLIAGAYLGGLMMLLMSGFTAYVYYAIRDRIPLAKVLLSSVAHVVTRFPATNASALVGALVAGLFVYSWIRIWILQVDGTSYHRSAAGHAMLVLFMLWHLFWTLQVIANAVHVTVSGLFATYYFMGEQDPSSGRVEVPIVHPTWKAARRALTTSLGPICFGSLFIAGMGTLRFLAHHARARSAHSGMSGLALCYSCMECLIQLIEDVMNYFNHYAFVQVAIFGKGFYEAGRSTWQMFEDRGFDALINDDLTYTVFIVGGIVTGSVSAVVGFLWARGRFYEEAGGAMMAHVFVASWCFLVASSVFHLLCQSIRSGVVTTFVCLAEDPATLARKQPALFARFQAAYPSVRWGARSTVPPCAV